MRLRSAKLKSCSLVFEQQCGLPARSSMTSQGETSLIEFVIRQYPRRDEECVTKAGHIIADCHNSTVMDSEIGGSFVDQSHAPSQIQTRNISPTHMTQAANSEENQVIKSYSSSLV